MISERIRELYDGMLNHISELVSGTDLVDTLHAIGFTDEEISAEGFMVEDDGEDNDFDPDGRRAEKPWDYGKHFDDEEE